MASRKPKRKESARSAPANLAEELTRTASDAATTEAGAGTGVESSQSRHIATGAQAETAMDVGQAEQVINDLIRSARQADSFESVMKTYMAGFGALGLQAILNNQQVANRVANNGVNHDQGWHTINVSEQQRTVRIGDKTTTIDIATLAELLDRGMISAPSGKK